MGWSIQLSRIFAADGRNGIPPIARTREIQDSLVFLRLWFSHESGSRHATLRALADNDGMDSPFPPVARISPMDKHEDAVSEGHVSKM
jgi:hypothetical protein